MLAQIMLPFILANPSQPGAALSSRWEDAGARLPAISLDGQWTLTTDRSPQAYQIGVPGSWQAQIPELRDYTGSAVYSRRFDLPESWRSKRVFVRFGAVDYVAEVAINSQPVGQHEGGYTPFEFDITSMAKFGEENEITVRVTDPGAGKPVGDLRFEDIPHGKQMWYGNASGLWQSVTLEARNAAHVGRIVIDPDVDSSSARFVVRLAGECSGKLRVRVKGPDCAPEVPDVAVDVQDSLSPRGAGEGSAAGSLSPKGAGEGSTASSLSPQGAGEGKGEGGTQVSLSVPIPTPALWSPESPMLYEARVELTQNGQVVDSLDTTFGMREIEAKNGQVLVNGKPIFIAGVLDQDFYPGTEYTVPSDKYLRDQFLQAKRLGLNLMRCHIKIPDPRYLEWADRLGLLVWYELPNWVDLTDDAKRRGRELLKAALERDHNHPSLVIVSVMNESWGIDLTKPENCQWLGEMYDFTKALEPSRLIVDNSPCSESSHVKTDIEDFHIYMSIPDQAERFRQWTKEFAGHPDYTFTGGAKRRGFEPLVVSEFGNWGLPKPSKLRDWYGGDPWWFDTFMYEIAPVANPRGFDGRFAEQKLASVFGDMDGLADAFQEQEWMALKFQIEEMRRYPSIAGYVITEFTDIHWESNGLLDYCRNPKTFHNIMHTVQDPDIVFARTNAANYVSGDLVVADLYVSHFSSRSLDGCRVEWSLDGTRNSGSEDVHEVEAGYAGVVAKVEMRARRVDAPRRFRMSLRLVSKDGSTIATNYHDFTVFPAAQPDIPADAVISDKLDDATVAKIRGGANAVICIEKPEALQEAVKDIKAVNRDESERSGAWCSTLIWFRESPAFDGSPVSRTSDMSMEAVTPSCVLDGVGFENWENDVLSGIFVGWIHKPGAIVLQVRMGSGKAVITTLPLVSAREKDPMARHLLTSLARYVSSERCAPGLAVQ